MGGASDRRNAALPVRSAGMLPTGSSEAMSSMALLRLRNKLMSWYTLGK
jgi:hypothetical protein